MEPGAHVGTERAIFLFPSIGWQTRVSPSEITLCQGALDELAARLQRAQGLHAPTHVTLSLSLKLSSSSLSDIFGKDPSVDARILSACEHQVRMRHGVPRQRSVRDHLRVKVSRATNLSLIHLKTSCYCNKT